MKIYSVKWSCKRYKYLVLDERNSSTFVRKMAIDPDQIFFVNTHCLTIFIFPLIKILIKRMIEPGTLFTNIKELYLLSIINSVDPSFIISAVDNNKNYWCLKNYYPQKKIFLIQNGLRGTTDLKANEFFYLNTRKFQVDALFVMTKAEKDWYLENGLNVENIHVCGSIKSNHIALNAATCKPTLVYLLQYKKHDYVNAGHQSSRYLDRDGNFISYEEIYGKNGTVIKTLEGFCAMNSLRLEIFGRAKEDRGAEMEKAYLSHLGFGHVDYVFRSSEVDTYQYLDQVSFIITLGSTLGHEMFSRGRSVFFWGIQRCFGRDTVFGYGKLGQSGEFWTDSVDPRKVAAHLSRFISYTDFEKSKFRGKYADFIMPLDDKNMQLNEKLCEAFTLSVR